MLTFFEYLRLRAYESVMEGARAALEDLDAEGAYKQLVPPTKTETELPPRLQSSPIPNDAGPKDREQAEQAATTSAEEELRSTIASDDAETVPEPRRRGRPRKNGSRA